MRYNGRLIFSGVPATINRYFTGERTDAYKVYGLGKYFAGFDITESGTLQNIVGFHYAYSMLPSGVVVLSITSESCAEAFADGSESPTASDSHHGGRKRSDVDGGRDQSARGPVKRQHRIKSSDVSSSPERTQDDDAQPPAPFFDPFAAPPVPFHPGMPLPEGYEPHPYPSGYHAYPYPPQQHPGFPGAPPPHGAMPYHPGFYPPHPGAPGFPPQPHFWGYPPHPHHPFPPHPHMHPHGPYWPPHAPPPGSMPPTPAGGPAGSDGPPSPSSKEAAAVLQALWQHPPEEQAAAPAQAPAEAPAKASKQDKDAGGGRSKPAARPASSRAQTTITMGSSFVKKYFQKLLNPDGVTAVSFDVLQNGVKVASGVHVSTTEAR